MLRSNFNSEQHPALLNLVHTVFLPVVGSFVTTSNMITWGRWFQVLCTWLISGALHITYIRRCMPDVLYPLNYYCYGSYYNYYCHLFYLHQYYYYYYCYHCHLHFYILLLYDYHLYNFHRYHCRYYHWCYYCYYSPRSQTTKQSHLILFIIPKMVDMKFYGEIGG